MILLGFWQMWKCVRSGKMVMMSTPLIGYYKGNEEANKRGWLKNIEKNIRKQRKT